MSDTRGRDETLAKATIAVALIQRSGLLPDLDITSLARLASSEGFDWRKVGALRDLRLATEAIYRALDEPEVLST